MGHAPSAFREVACNDPAVTSVVLHTRQTRVTREELDDLCTALRKNTHVHTLDLFGQQERIGPAAAKSIADMLTVNQSLTSLQLWCCELRDEGALHLAAGLRRHPALRALNIGGTNGIRETASLHAVCDALANCPQLRELNFWGCRALGQGASTAPLITLFQPHVCSLESVSLEACRLNGPPLHALLTFLHNNTRLHTLLLRANLFSTADACAMAALLHANRSLTSVSASVDHDASLDGARALVASLQRNRSVVSFALDLEPRIEAEPYATRINEYVTRNKEAKEEADAPADGSADR
jgi:hypothetical protein